MAEVARFGGGKLHAPTGTLRQALAGFVGQEDDRSPPYAAAVGRKKSMPAVRPKAIVFDTFGTVVDWRSSLIADLSEYGARKGVHADWAGLVDAWRAAYHPSMDRVRLGEQPWTKLDHLHRASLDHL